MSAATDLATKLEELLLKLVDGLEMLLVRILAFLELCEEDEIQSYDAKCDNLPVRASRTACCSFISCSCNALTLG